MEGNPNQHHYHHLPHSIDREYHHNRLSPILRFSSNRHLSALLLNTTSTPTPPPLPSAPSPTPPTTTTKQKLSHQRMSDSSSYSQMSHDTQFLELNSQQEIPKNIIQNKSPVSNSTRSSRFLLDNFYELDINCTSPSKKQKTLNKKTIPEEEEQEDHKDELEHKNKSIGSSLTKNFKPPVKKIPTKSKIRKIKKSQRTLTKQEAQPQSLSEVTQLPPQYSKPFKRITQKIIDNKQKKQQQLQLTQQPEESSSMNIPDDPISSRIATIEIENTEEVNSEQLTLKELEQSLIASSKISIIPSQANLNPLFSKEDLPTQQPSQSFILPNRNAISVTQPSASPCATKSTEQLTMQLFSQQQDSQSQKSQQSNSAKNQICTPTFFTPSQTTVEQVSLLSSTTENISSSTNCAPRTTTKQSNQSFSEALENATTHTSMETVSSAQRKTAETIMNEFTPQSTYSIPISAVIRQVTSSIPIIPSKRYRSHQLMKSKAKRSKIPSNQPKLDPKSKIIKINQHLKQIISKKWIKQPTIKPKKKFQQTYLTTSLSRSAASSSSVLASPNNASAFVMMISSSSSSQEEQLFQEVNTTQITEVRDENNLTEFQLNLPNTRIRNSHESTDSTSYSKLSLKDKILKSIKKAEKKLSQASLMILELKQSSPQLSCTSRNHQELPWVPATSNDKSPEELIKQSEVNTIIDSHSNDNFEQDEQVPLLNNFSGIGGNYSEMEVVIPTDTATSKLNFDSEKNIIGNSILLIDDTPQERRNTPRKLKVRIQTPQGEIQVISPRILLDQNPRMLAEYLLSTLK